MIAAVRRLLASTGGVRGMFALVAITWGLQELTEIATERTAHLDELDARRDELTAALERERALVTSWREERLSTFGGVDVVADAVRVEVAEPPEPKAEA